MIRHFATVCFLITVFPCVSLAQNWTWAAPIPTGDNCYALSFADSLEGWLIAGGSGIVSHTSDGGATWEYQDPGIRDYYRGMFFLDREHGWLVGGNVNRLISRTTDGGKSWSIPIHDSLAGSLLAVQFLTPDTGYVARDINLLLKTTDGGATWTKKYLYDRNIGAMFFLNPQWGVVRSFNFLRTTNGGDSWEEICPVASPDQGALYFSDTLHGIFASQSSGLSRSTDGGRAWQSVSGRVSLQSLSFPRPELGWAFGSAGIYATSDSGKTWMQQSSAQVSQGQMLSTTLGYACGGFGNLYRTTDGGQNWVNISRHVVTGDLRGVARKGKDLIWAAGGTTPTTGGAIVYSSDAGVHWAVQYSQPNNRFHSLTFSDTSTLWACGIGGTAVRTTDLGLSWTPVTMPVTVNLHKIAFADRRHGLSTGDAVILRTSDGGASWQVYPGPFDTEVWGLSILDSSSAWTAGGSQNSGTGLILKTTDGGVSWETQFSGQVGVLRGITFQDPLRGWAYGDTLLHTSDGGLTWEGRLRPSGVLGVNALHFVDSNRAWFSTWQGEIFRSSDGGSSWQLTRTPTSMRIFDLAMASDESGVAVGTFGDIFRTTGSGPDNVDEGGTQLQWPTEFSLCQNYPNPFNPVTQIYYTIWQSEDYGTGGLWKGGRNVQVQLIVYDILGRQVAVLVDERKAPGSYSVKFDAAGLSSGVYFYRLQAGRHFETRKMILMR